MDNLLKDIRFALRTLRKSSGFTVVAILTLALGIGSNTAMFSVVTAVLLRPLPFPEPERIMQVSSTGELRKFSSESYPDFFDYRQRNRSFEYLSAYHAASKTLTGVGEPQHLQANMVTPGFFEALGVQPKLGRTFRPEEEKPGNHVAILSENLWRILYQGDSSILGKPMNLDGKAYTIIGIMPEGFQFPISAKARDLWITTAEDAEVDVHVPGDHPVTTQRGAHFLRVVGRLKPGVTPQQAEQDIASIMRSLEQQYPDTNYHRSGALVKPQLEALVGDNRMALVILLGAVGCVLLIACVNIANLLLARGAGRSREIAIRTALGASRMRIVRQLVTESLLLALAGTALGVGIASWAVAALVKLYPQNLPRLSEVSIDMRVLLFSLGVAVVSAILFGLFPALQVTKVNVEESLREGGRAGSSLRHKRFRTALVVAETALGVVLLVGAGLLIRSFERLTKVDPGFRSKNLLTLNFDLPSGKYDNEKSDQFVREFFDRVRAQPGIDSAAGTAMLPMGNSYNVISFEIEGRPQPKGQDHSAAIVVVTPRYFETMKIPVLQGRTFDERDQRKAPPVMIISQAMAQKYYPGENPIGKRIKIGANDSPGEDPWREIVGVVGDIRNTNLSAPPEAMYYIPFSQLVWGTPTIVVHTNMDAAAAAPTVRNVLHDMDPELPLYEIRTMDDYLALSVGRQRFQTILLGCFAGIALLLTAVGLYGVMAYSVAQRTREIGIRMALGATQQEVRQMVLGAGAKMAGIGLVIGVVGALVLTRFMQSMLYEMKSHDPVTFIGVCVVLGAVSMLASYIPARRATKVDPVVALRYE
jgi:putative ABC transport system permease protein